MDIRNLTIIVDSGLVVRLMGRLAREMEALQQEIAQAPSPPGPSVVQLAALLEDASSELSGLAEAVERAKTAGNVIQPPTVPYERARPLVAVTVWDVLDAKGNVVGTHALEKDARAVVLAHAPEGWALRVVQTLSEYQVKP